MGKRKFNFGDIVNFNQKTPKSIKRKFSNPENSIFVVIDYITQSWHNGKYSIMKVEPHMISEIATYVEQHKNSSIINDTFSQRNLSGKLRNFIERISHGKLKNHIVKVEPKYISLSLNKNDHFSYLDVFSKRIEKNNSEIEKIIKENHIIHDMIKYIENNGEERFNENDYRNGLKIQRLMNENGIDIDIEKSISLAKNVDVKN